MKQLTLIIALFFLLQSCNNENTLEVDNSWNLVKVTGGFAGINENFAKGKIKWTFNEQNTTLIIEKNTNESFTGMAEGTYNYSIVGSNDNSYLLIDSQEMGGIIFTGNSMEIDENKRSTGSGADGFILHFEK